MIHPRSGDAPHRGRSHGPRIDLVVDSWIATVRRLVIDALSPDELATLGQISKRILDRLDNLSP
jgi:hypothetical protein